MSTKPINTLESALTYHLCPVCARSVPAQTGEHHCLNDGARLLEGCPKCAAAITNPYARHCVNCGQALLRGSKQIQKGDY